MRPRCRHSTTSSVETLDGEEGRHTTRIETTPLFEATKAQDLPLIRRLLEAGADLNARNGSEGMAALHWAAMRGYVEAVYLLLDYGATADIQQTPGGATPLKRAAMHAPQDDAGAETVRLLVTRGADVNARSKSGWGPVHSAAIRPRSTILTAILSAGAVVDLADENGLTPLMSLYVTGPMSYGNAKLLLEHGAAVNAQDQAGHTPLMWAAMQGQLEWAQFLLQVGADAAIRDLLGLTAADHAQAPSPDNGWDGMKLRLHMRIGKPELNEPVLARREKLAAFLRDAAG